MPPPTHPPPIPPAIAELLARLRQRIRAYVWIEGIAALVVTLALAFWMGLALDWAFEPSPRVRVVALTVVAVLLLLICYRFILRRAFARLGDASLALLIERTHADLQDSLLTSVELAASDAPPASVEMLAHTADDARQHVDSVRLGPIFNFRPLTQTVAAAALLVASIVVFGLLGSETFGFWMQRIGLTQEQWPRKVALVALDFPPDASGIRTEKLARDDEFELTVRASLEDRFIAPSDVEIRYRTEDGQRGRDTMTQVGTATAGRDAFQEFKYTFKNIATDLTFDIVGGDDRVRDLHLKIVNRPALKDMKLHCDYPAYVGMPPDELDVTGTMQIPEGTELTLLATATKPLVEARLHAPDEADDLVVDFTGRQNRVAMRFARPPLTEDTVLLVSLVDQDGVRTREPIRVAISMLVDAPPEVAVRLDGIGSAVTPDARIPFVGTIQDPRYGLDACWFTSQIDGGADRLHAFTAEVAGRQELRVAEAVDARTLDPESKERVLALSPGQKLTILVKASDRYDLTNAPHFGSSQPFTLDVVSPDKLRALLERRELSLRQRFETLVEKTRDTRRLLTRVEFTDAASAEADSAGSESGESESDDSNPDPETADADDTDRLRERRRLRVVSATQNMVQVAQETLGVAESFDQIQAELVNNRIDTEELLLRLSGAIADPLRKIALGQIPALEKQLNVVQSSIGDTVRGKAELQTALTKTDEVLVAMQQVLDKMLELESYNEVLDLLRSVIEDQEQLQRKTKKKQRERLKGLE
jgi:hypothetical protein